MSGFEIAAIALVAAGTAVSAYGAIRSGQAAAQQGSLQQQLANRQSKVTDQQGDIERIVSGQEATDFRRQQSYLMARRRAILGGTGIDQATGSPLLASQDFARETELQALRIRAGGEIRATRLEQQAMFQRYQGSLLNFSGQQAQTAGYLRGGASLLSGAGQAGWMTSQALARSDSSGSGYTPRTKMLA